MRRRCRSVRLSHAPRAAATGVYIYKPFPIPLCAPAAGRLAVDATAPRLINFAALR